MPDITGDGINDIDITSAGSSTVIGGVTFTDAVNVGAGTGGYNTFLAVQDDNDAGASEAGFNSNDTNPLDPTNDEIDHSKTHTVKLSDLVVITVLGVQYYEFRVDLNEANSDPNAQISLDEFQLWTSASSFIESTTSPTVDKDGNPGPSLFSQNLIYDMDATGDVSVLLSDAESSGSGTDDYSVLVPITEFAGLDPTNTYVYLYVQMGAAGVGWGANATFEEWNLQNGVTLTGHKFEDINNNGVLDAGEPGVEGVTIYIDANRNGQLDAGERTTTTDEDGNYSFFGVPTDQTIWIDEDPDETQTTGDHEEVIIPENATPGSTIFVDPIGNFIPRPSLNITKVVTSVTDGADFGGSGQADSVGDVINYGITVQNTSNVVLTGLTVKDAVEGGAQVDAIAVTAGGFNTGDSNTNGAFDPGETWNFTASYTLTQADINNNGPLGPGDGDIDNIATADSDQTGPDTDDAVQPIVYAPALNINKVVTSVTDGADFGGSGQADSVGDVINYGITVQNTGNVTLTGLTVKDAVEGGAQVDATAVTAGGFNTGDTNTNGLFDVGETWNFTASYTLTQADINNNGPSGPGDGDIDNIATADSDQTGPDTDDAFQPIVYSPALNINKVVTSVTDGADFGGSGQADSAGDVINYGITVQNTGNVTLTGLTVKDAVEGGSQVDATPVTAGGFNTGDTNTNGLFDVGETWNFTASYTLTQADINNNGPLGPGDGDIDNIATADSDQTGPDTDDAFQPIVYSPALNINKVVTSVTDGVDFGASGQVDSAGDVINYGITVQNTGNVTLTGLTVKDAVEGGSQVDATPVTAGGFNTGDTNTNGAFDPGETWNFTANYTVTQPDLDSNGVTNDGDIDNIATADSDQTGPDTDDATVPVVQNPDIELDKLVFDPDTLAFVDGGVIFGPGDEIIYQYRVTNTGSVGLTGVTVTDDNATPLDPTDDVNWGVDAVDELVRESNGNGDEVLDVGETWVFTYTTNAPDGGGGGGAGLPVSTDLMNDFLLIGTTSNKIAKAVNVQNGDLGADAIVLSTEINDNVDFDLDDVFLNNAGAQWVDFDNLPNTEADFLPGAADIHEGVSWTGDVALTSPTGKFDFSNVELYGQVGVVADSAKPSSSVSNSLFFGNGVGDGVDPAGGLAMPANGVTKNADAQMAALRAELDAFEDFVTELPSEFTLKFGTGLPDATGIEDEPLFIFDIDAYDTNNDGIAVIDIEVNGDFKITNSNWIIDGDGSTIAIFRILGGSNLVLNQSTIMLGDGGIGGEHGLGAMFIKAAEFRNADDTGYNAGEGNTGDTVFSFNDTVLNGVGFYDLIVFDEDIGNANFDNGTTEIKVDDGQGCSHFVAPEINFNNVRFERCDPPDAPDQLTNTAEATGTAFGATVDDSDLVTVTVGGGGAQQQAIASAAFDRFTVRVGGDQQQAIASSAFDWFKMGGGGDQQQAIASAAFDWF